jgi:hypothetical protein
MKPSIGRIVLYHPQRNVRDKALDDMQSLAAIVVDVRAACEVDLYVFPLPGCGGVVLERVREYHPTSELEDTGPSWSWPPREE